MPPKKTKKLPKTEEKDAMLPETADLSPLQSNFIHGGMRKMVFRRITSFNTILKLQKVSIRRCNVLRLEFGEESLLQPSPLGAPLLEPSSQIVKIETFTKFLKHSSSLKSCLRYLLSTRLDALPNRDTLLFLSRQFPYLRAIKFVPINATYFTNLKDYNYTVNPEAFKLSLPKTITKIEIDQNTVLPQTSSYDLLKNFYETGRLKIIDIHSKLAFSTFGADPQKIIFLSLEHLTLTPYILSEPKSKTYNLNSLKSLNLIDDIDGINRAIHNQVLPRCTFLLTERKDSLQRLNLVICENLDPDKKFLEAVGELHKLHTLSLKIVITEKTINLFKTLSKLDLRSLTLKFCWHQGFSFNPKDMKIMEKEFQNWSNLEEISLQDIKPYSIPIERYKDLDSYYAGFISCLPRLKALESPKFQSFDAFAKNLKKEVSLQILKIDFHFKLRADINFITKLLSQSKQMIEFKLIGGFDEAEFFTELTASLKKLVKLRKLILDIRQSLFIKYQELISILKVFKDLEEFTLTDRNHYLTDAQLSNLFKEALKLTALQKLHVFSCPRELKPYEFFSKM